MSESAKFDFIAAVKMHCENSNQSFTVNGSPILSNTREEAVTKAWFTDPRYTYTTMRLTKYGQEFLEAVDYPSYKIQLKDAWRSTAGGILNMRAIKCPWYLKGKTLWLYGDREANWLTMLDGDLNRFLEQWRS